MSSKANTYVLVGGGSGGHLTPLVPIAEEIKKLDPYSKVVHIGQKGDPLNLILETEKVFDERLNVSAGKFRRYNGEKWIKKLTDFRTIFFNFRDLFRFIIGILQSRRILKKLSPDIVFTKGGYVCAPVGLAAGSLGITYVTHDSDAMVSLAHRIIAKKAKLHLTAMQEDLYFPQYSKEKTMQVGVPVRKEFSYVNSQGKIEAKTKLGYKSDDHLLLIVGGGLGAKNINDAVVEQSLTLFNSDSKLKIVHVSGHKLYEQTENKYSIKLTAELRNRVSCFPFLNDVSNYSAAADLIITRAGATNMAELATQGKACIVVPNPLLAGGHQLKNAEALSRASAVEIIHEQELDKITKVVSALMKDNKRRSELEKNLHTLSNEQAAAVIAKTLFDIVSSRGH